MRFNSLQSATELFGSSSYKPAMETVAILGFLAVGISGLGSLFSILALAMHNWQVLGSSSVGLWKLCVLDECVSLTGDYVSSGLQATRAMLSLGMLFMIATTVSTIMFVFIIKESRLIQTVSMSTAFAAGFFHVAGVSIYAREIKEDPTNYGAAFGLAILTWLLSWAVVGLVFFIRRRGSSA